MLPIYSGMAVWILNASNSSGAGAPPGRRPRRPAARPGRGRRGRARPATRPPRGAASASARRRPCTGWCAWLCGRHRPPPCPRTTFPCPARTPSPVQRIEMTSVRVSLTVVFMPRFLSAWHPAISFYDHEELLPFVTIMCLQTS